MYTTKGRHSAKKYTWKCKVGRMYYLFQKTVCQKILTKYIITMLLDCQICVHLHKHDCQVERKTYVHAVWGQIWANVMWNAALVAPLFAAGESSLVLQPDVVKFGQYMTAWEIAHLDN